MFERAIAPVAQPFSALWGVAVTPHFAPWDEGEETVAADGLHTDASAANAPAHDWDAGFADGWAAAIEKIAADHAAQQDAQQNLITALQNFVPMPDQLLVDALRMHILALLRDLIGTAAIDETLLLERCGAMARIAADDGAATLYLNPEDLALIDGMVPGVALSADPALPRGDIRLLAGAMTVAQGPQAALTALDEGWTATADHAGRGAC